LIRHNVENEYNLTVSYLTLEVAIDHGKVVPTEPDRLPETGRGLLTILPSKAVSSASKKAQHSRVKLPLIRGDGSRMINPTPEELDASLWD
jgi:hypothetical protein